MESAMEHDPKLRNTIEEN